MPRKSVTIGNKEFKSKTAAKDFFREILNRNKRDVTIEGGDHDILLALVKLHSEAEEKMGTGVKRFYKAGNIGGTTCFWIERTDGTNKAFSFAYVINEASEK